MKQIQVLINNCSNKISKLFGINLNYFVKNGIWVFSNRFIHMLTAIGTSVLFARLVSKNVFGQYQFLLALIAMFSIISIPGFDTPIMISAVKGLDGTYKKAVKLRFFWSLFGVPLFIILGGYYYFIKGDMIFGVCLFILALFFPLYNALNSWRPFLQGKEKFKLAMIFSSFHAIINLLAIFISILIGNGKLIPIFATYLLIYTIFNIFYYFKTQKIVTTKKEEKGWKKYGYFLTKINILSVVVGNLDKILVGTLLGVQELAVYAIGINFAKQIQAFIKEALMIATPRIAKKNTLNFKTYLFIFISTVVIGVLLIFVTPSIITLLFTSKYSDSIYLSQIVLVFIPFFVINNLYSKHFKYYLKDKKILLGNFAITPLIKLALMFIFISLFKKEGLAFIFGFQVVISLGVMFVLSHVFKNRKVKKGI